MHHGLFLTCGIYSIFSTKYAVNATLSPPDLWELYHCLYLTCGKCIIASISPVGNALIFLPYLWEMHHCFYFTCGKCINVLPHLWEMHISLYFNWVKCIMVSSSLVGNAAFSLQNMRQMKEFLHLTCGIYISLFVPQLWEMNQCLYFNCGKYIIFSISPMGNALLSLPHLW